MPVNEFDAGDLFTLEIHKEMADSPDDSWVNTYEFLATAAGYDATLEALAGRWAQFERELTRSSVFFSSAHVRTWHAEVVPGSTDFMDVPLVYAGLVGSPAQMAPLDTCLWLNREVNYGRTGRLMLRGVLSTDAFTSAGGKRSLTDPSYWNAAVQAALAASGAEDDIGVAAPAFRLSMISSEPSVRRVTELNVRGVTIVKTNHRWFNRSPSD